MQNHYYEQYFQQFASNSLCINACHHLSATIKCSINTWQRANKFPSGRLWSVKGRNPLTISSIFHETWGVFARLVLTVVLRRRWRARIFLPLIYFRAVTRTSSGAMAGRLQHGGHISEPSSGAGTGNAVCDNQSHQGSDMLIWIYVNTIPLFYCWIGSTVTYNASTDPVELGSTRATTTRARLMLITSTTWETFVAPDGFATFSLA